MTAIPSPVRTVLDLFTSELADVRFGDVDAQTLARVAADVQASADVVASAQAALESARGTLHDRQEALLQQVQRALAYARVYAEADEAMSARLAAIALPRASRRARGEPDATDALVLSTEPQPALRPRGRPRKVLVTLAPVASIAPVAPLAPVALLAPVPPLGPVASLVPPKPLESLQEELAQTGE